MDNEVNRPRANRLIHEKSPYLLQHAHNPVDWYPWSDEAFELAKKEDKPVFVSIGYSACHWCHVMEKECFNDEEVANLMNRSFVCVKVDREERPDLDGAYMAVCQRIGRSCGWPLNIVMTPDKNPFLTASYVPKNSRFGLIGMLALIPQIEQVWKTRREDLENFGRSIMRSLETMGGLSSQGDLDKQVLDNAYEWLSQNFDEENSGFGQAPKFPSPHNLIFLMRYWNRTKEKTALAMAEKTLRAMRLGGIFDQVGFGFHRYSTDAQWRVPHFEKMLYDQAMLALAYVEAYWATGALKFKVTAKEVLEYVMRDMTSSEGGFYSAEDADSEGEEGKFYMWTEEEIRNSLLPEDANLAVSLFGIRPEGNYVEPGKNRTGLNILHWEKSLEQVARESQLTVDETIHNLGRICTRLFEARKKRVHPLKDDKVLADWNGLMIAAMAKASRVFAEQKYLQTAVKASDFVLNKMRDKRGMLLHRYAQGNSEIEGFLDDYAFLVWGLIEVYEASFDDKVLQTAIELSNEMIARFWDEKDGGFFFNAKNAKDAVLKRKELHDGALPSGNSVALLDLLRLERLAGNASFGEKAIRMLRSCSGEITRAPAAHTFMLVGLEFALGPAYNVVLVGELQESSTLSMIEALRLHYLPHLTVSIRKPSTTGLGYEKIGNKATAYVCRGQTCMTPTNSPAKILELLDLPEKG